MPLVVSGGETIMIVGKCKDCNYTARYNSKYFSVLELQKHIISFPMEQDECSHSLIYSQEEDEE